jgi:L-amino acid N-acyltransferase YncA
LPIDIVAATAADVNAIAEIAGTTVDWHHARLPHEIAAFDRDAERQAVKQILGQRTNHLLVARDGGEVIGFAHYLIIERNAFRALAALRMAFIEHIAVRADRQRQGVGHALLGGVRQHLRREKIAELRANIFEVNTASAAFFEKEGFGSFARIWRSDVPEDQDRQPLDAAVGRPGMGAVRSG